MATEVHSAESPCQESVDFSVAMMLLASVTFMMSTFYLVNVEDEDLQQAAWRVISATISIFSAVLLFSAVDGCVTYFTIGDTEEVEATDKNILLLKNALQGIVWYLLLQSMLALISGAVSCRKGGDHWKEGKDSMSIEKQKVKAKLDMKCWAVLFGHVTGFACINAFAVFQGNLVEEGASGSSMDLFKTGSVCLLAILVLSTVYTIAERIRNVVNLSDDGVIDEFEGMWNNATIETEDDILGLTVSFVFVQMLRFGITGVLPNEEGKVEGFHPGIYTVPRAVLLMTFGVSFFGVHIIRTILIKGNIVNKRFKEQFKVVAGMVLAWCFFFSSQWNTTLIVGHFADAKSAETIVATGLAMAITFMCYLCIWLLDKLADLECTGPEIDKDIRELIKALGILIGFAWERSFDAAVFSVAEKGAGVMPPAVTKLIMSVCICFTVIPAWRWYILPTLLKLKCFDEEDEDEEDEGTESGLVYALAARMSVEQHGDARRPSTWGLDAPLLADAKVVAANSSAVAVLDDRVAKLEEELRVLRVAAARAHAPAANVRASPLAAASNRPEVPSANVRAPLSAVELNRPELPSAASIRASLPALALHKASLPAKPSPSLAAKAPLLAQSSSTPALLAPELGRLKAGSSSVTSSTAASTTALAATPPPGSRLTGFSRSPESSAVRGLPPKSLFGRTASEPILPPNRPDGTSPLTAQLVSRSPSPSPAPSRSTSPTRSLSPAKVPATPPKASPSGVRTLGSSASATSLRPPSSPAAGFRTLGSSAFPSATSLRPTASPASTPSSPAAGFRTLGSSASSLVAAPSATSLRPTASPASTAAPGFSEDVNALKQICNANEELRTNARWFEDAPTIENVSKWVGVSTSGGRVTELKVHAAVLPDDGLARLSSLTVLDLSSSDRLAVLPAALGSLSSLVSLKLNGCIALTAIPESIGGCRSLTWLNVGGCRELAALPESLGNLKALRRLEMWHCKKVSALPKSIGGLQQLSLLNARNCGKLERIPEQITDCIALRELDVRGCGSSGSPLIRPDALARLRGRGVDVKDI